MPVEIDARFFRDLYQAINWRIWWFLTPLAGGLVGSYLGIIAFYVTRAILSGIQRKKVRLERRMDAAKQVSLQARSELADALKENRRLRIQLRRLEAEKSETNAHRRAIVELARRAE